VVRLDGCAWSCKGISIRFIKSEPHPVEG
jgi:hypothetical protein